jgi:hypothetical protein
MAVRISVAVGIIGSEIIVLGAVVMMSALGMPVTRELGMPVTRELGMPVTRELGMPVTTSPGLVEARELGAIVGTSNISDGTILGVSDTAAVGTSVKVVVGPKVGSTVPVARLGLDVGSVVSASSLSQGIDVSPETLKNLVLRFVQLVLGKTSSKHLLALQ